MKKRDETSRLHWVNPSCVEAWILMNASAGTVTWWHSTRLWHMSLSWVLHHIGVEPLQPDECCHLTAPARARVSFTANLIISQRASNKNHSHQLPTLARHTSEPYRNYWSVRSPHDCIVWYFLVNDKRLPIKATTNQQIMLGFFCCFHPNGR